MTADVVARDDGEFKNGNFGARVTADGMTGKQRIYTKGEGGRKINKAGRKTRTWRKRQQARKRDCGTDGDNNKRKQWEGEGKEMEGR